MKESEPPIWRRIQVPETYTFWDLHVAIQDAMGWKGYHMYEFRLKQQTTNKEAEISSVYGEPEFRKQNIISDREEKIAEWFSSEHGTGIYIYDFGDNWEHIIELEDILPKKKGIKYPICLDGEKACPPEDCGGIWGYREFLEAVNNPKHEEDQAMLEWAGGNFDSEHFEAEEVRFGNPEELWESILKSENVY